MNESKSTLPRRIAAAKPEFSDQDRAVIARVVDQVLRSGRFILGEQTHGFEEEFRRLVGTDHAVAVASCTAALQIVLRFYGVQGREVVLPTNNFPGVVSAVLYEGGRPIFADMNPSSFGADIDDLLSRVTPQTAGVILVHIAGLVDPEIERVRRMCRERGLFLIEDGSHAHGASLDGRRVGSLTDAGCFSFYPTKIMTSLTGGMITTDNGELAAFSRCLRHHGMGARHGEFVALGHDWCMSEVHAAIGRAQLARLEAFVDHRNRVVGWYREALRADDRFVFPAAPARARHAYYKLPLLLSERVNRDAFRRIMWEDFGVENGLVYDPLCHQLEIFRPHVPAPRRPLAIAEQTLRRQFCPPVHASIAADDVGWVVAGMREAATRALGS